MKGLMRSCLVVLAILFGLLLAGMAAMAILGVCPPPGPWPPPPWCGGDGTVTLPPVPPIKIVLESPEITVPDAVTVSTDVRSMNYADLYADPSPADVTVADPYCAIDKNEVVFPAAYLGSHGLPQAQGAPLPAEIQRAVGIKDVWIPEPNLNTCPISIPYAPMREALDKTLVRVRALGADAITFSNYVSLTDFESARLQTPQQAATSALDLQYVARKAQDMGLDMTLYLNLASGAGPVSDEIPSEAWLTTLIHNWEPFVLSQARLAEETGIDALLLNHFDYEPWIKGYEDIYQTEMLALLEKVRDVYSGRVLFSIEPLWGADLAALEHLLGSVDGFVFTPTTTPLRDSDDKTVGVPNLKRLYLENLRNIGQDFGRFDRPFLIRILIQSEKGFLENGWNEDMFCISRDGDPCYQKSLQVDFSVQAVAYEALLEAISEAQTEGYLAIDEIDTYGYWFTDVMLPEVSQPQIGHSIRNKPAETLILEWFKR